LESAGDNDTEVRAAAKQVSESFVQAFNAGDIGTCVSLLNNDKIQLWEKGYQKINHKGIVEAQEFLKKEMAVGRQWEFDSYKDYSSNKEYTVTMLIKETGLDYTLAGVDMIGSEFTFTVKDGKITKMYIFVKAKTYEKFATNTAGTIGVELVTANGKTTIDKLLATSPAAEAGLLIGDEITAINGNNCADMQSMEAQLRTKGTIGSKVVLTVKKAATGETADVELVRVDAKKLAKENK